VKTDLHIFYTYAYLRKDGTPYYIGKGQGKRAFSKHHKIRPPRDKSRVLFLKTGLTEDEAFKHEIYMIAVFGRKDLGTGILRNRTNGGDGGSGRVVSEEERLKKVVSTREVRQRMTEKEKIEWRRKIAESLKGQSWSEETKRKRKENPYIPSVQARRKNANSHRGKKRSAETIRKMKEARKRRAPMSIAQRARISELHKGKEISAAQREAVSRRAKGTHWYVNEKGENRREVESPGPEWRRGRKWKPPE
jgi:hypothetical protein